MNLLRKLLGVFLTYRRIFLQEHPLGPFTLKLLTGATITQIQSGPVSPELVDTNQRVKRNNPDIENMRQTFKVRSFGLFPFYVFVLSEILGKRYGRLLRHQVRLGHLPSARQAQVPCDCSTHSRWSTSAEDHRKRSY